MLQWALKGYAKIIQLIILTVFAPGSPSYRLLSIKNKFGIFLKFSDFALLTL